MSIACTLAFSLTPAYGGIGYAAEAGSESPQATGETAKADTGAAPDYSLEAITVEAKRPDWESKLSPGTVTVIRPSDYKGEQKTLPELLQDVPGVHVRYVAGKGQYTTVTVRGSTASQVGVFVDGVLTNLGGDAAVDISTIPINNVERIEVYRGYIPARFGGTYMGGVINIVTKKPDKANISAQIGQSSWGGHTAGLEITQPLGNGSLLIGINRDESDGDFRYTNPGVKKAYDLLGQQFDQLVVTKIQNYNSSLDMLQNTSYGLGINIGWAPFASLEEVQQAFTIGSTFYNAVMGAGTTVGYSVDDLKFLFSDPGWFGYDPNFKKNWWDAQMAARPELASDTRYRRNNDYKNTDAIIKWQDDHWLIKGSWKKIDRGLPTPLPFTSYIDIINYTSIDMPGWFDRKRQELTTKDVQAGRRDRSGNLEWGWQVNYLDQDKRYRNLDDDPASEKVFSKWSAYDSQRLGGAIDGTYKAGDKHLLEFLANWSREKMDIDGNRMDKLDMDTEQTNALRFRTYYEQTLFNLQLQDTITLNQEADLWLTPSLRYNYSEVMGRAAGPPRKWIDKNHIWVKQEDSQVNDKVTWQLALKKKVDDSLTLRSTYGTYYRLLNLYEIAGDGAGIMPRPNSGNGNVYSSLFPVPEEGTQWDLSAIWDGKLLGAASSNVQLTYFGRKSENLLQLYRYGFDFWSYTNSSKGRANGMELQGNFNWDKWDLNLAGTYLHTKAWEQTNATSNAPPSYAPIKQTYTPEWEGSVRLTYRPDNRLAVFSEMKYVGEMYFNKYSQDQVQSTLTTVGLGVKYKVDKDFQLTAGVNDLFNKGPESLCQTKTYDALIQYPIQGRTYYATLQYRY